MVESPYFYLAILFVVGYGWHALLMYLQKKKSGSMDNK